jgi:hypothetical protein
VLNIRHFILSVLVACLLAGSAPSMACTPAACAANTECALVHCNCCGPNCPWRNSSQESKKQGAPCNQQCPLVAAGKTIAINNNTQPLAVALLGVAEARPFLIADTASCTARFHQPDTLSPPTLLRLACALTI